MQAFGNEGLEIITLVNGLLNDKTGMPLLSLLAVKNNRPVGHILFTKATIVQTDEPADVRILAPLAILPKAQNQGIGGQLIKTGLEQLKASGVELVFVLGHPNYYPRSGFKPAGVLGYEAPYYLPVKNATAWMVQELSHGVIKRVSGTVLCCKAMDKPEYWRE